MIAIRGNVGEFVLDLNESPRETHEFRVVSLDDNGAPVYWVVDYMSSDVISAVKKGDTMVRITVDFDRMTKNEYLYLVNARNESLLIMIYPNKEASAPKTYVFNADASVEDNVVKVSLNSTVNGEGCPWSCTYDGKPLDFGIDPMSGDGPSDVYITLRSTLYSSAGAAIDFTQDKSKKTVRVYLSFKENGDVSVKSVKNS